MMIMNSISRFSNYGMTNTDQMIKKIAGNPFAVTTVLKVARKIFAAFDIYYSGEVKVRGMTEAMHGTIQIGEFYSTYKNMMFWINLFSKDSLDKELLQESLHSSLCESSTKGRSIVKTRNLAENVMTEVMQQNAFHSKSEVYEAIRSSLEKRDLTPEIAQKIAEKVSVQQKKRSFVQLIYMACFTVTDFADNIFTLKRWQLLDLSYISGSTGCQSSPTCQYVTSLAPGKVLGTIATVGLMFAVGNSTYRTVNQGFKYSNAKQQKDKNEAYQELRYAFLDLFSGGIDLVTTAAPLVYTLSPGTIVALDLISHGMGLVYIMLRY